MRAANDDYHHNYINNNDNDEHHHNDNQFDNVYYDEFDNFNKDDFIHDNDLSPANGKWRMGLRCHPAGIATAVCSVGRDSVLATGLIKLLSRRKLFGTAGCL